MAGVRRPYLLFSGTSILVSAKLDIQIFQKDCLFVFTTWKLKTRNHDNSDMTKMRNSQ